MTTEEQLTLVIPSDATEKAARKGVNEIVQGRIFQRGQIMSWSLPEKVKFFEMHKIGMVVNFWSKLDADMSEAGVIYVYDPTPHSERMLDFDKKVLANYVVNWLKLTPGNAVLILCEAGKTRSVYFSILVLSTYLGIPLLSAYNIVNSKIKHSLKGFMLEELGVDTHHS